MSFKISLEIYNILTRNKNRKPTLFFKWSHSSEVIHETCVARSALGGVSPKYNPTPCDCTTRVNNLLKTHTVQFSTSERQLSPVECRVTFNLTSRFIRNPHTVTTILQGEVRAPHILTCAALVTLSLR